MSIRLDIDGAWVTGEINGEEVHEAIPDFEFFVEVIFQDSAKAKEFLEQPLVPHHAVEDLRQKYGFSHKSSRKQMREGLINMLSLPGTEAIDAAQIIFNRPLDITSVVAGQGVLEHALNPETNPFEKFAGLVCMKAGEQVLNSLGKSPRITNSQSPVEKVK